MSIFIEKDGRRYRCKDNLLSADINKEVKQADENDEMSYVVRVEDSDVRIFSVVELEQECNKEKIVTDNHLFSSHENALAFLHRRYLDVREKMDAGAGEFSADFSEDGWYVCVDKDGDLYEGCLSEGMRVDFSMTDAILEEWRACASESK